MVYSTFQRNEVAEDSTDDSGILTGVKISLVIICTILIVIIMKFIYGRKDTYRLLRISSHSVEVKNYKPKSHSSHAQEMFV